VFQLNHSVLSWFAETKDQWARDDPAFVLIMTALITVGFARCCDVIVSPCTIPHTPVVFQIAAVAYGIAFQLSTVGAWVWLLMQVMAQFYLTGAIVATTGWYVRLVSPHHEPHRSRDVQRRWIGNKYLRVHHAHR